MDFQTRNNVMRTIPEFETAGVSALTIEDTALPTSFARAELQGLISLDEGVGKMRGALAIRQDPSLAIIARTGTMGRSDEHDAINRAKAYEKTGVDALFLVNICH
jgi:carboxyvinyl-carboxyphosphonate phosphorylmutase